MAQKWNDVEDYMGSGRFTIDQDRLFLCIRNKDPLGFH